MTNNTMLARSLTFSSPFAYQELLCQIDRLSSYNFPQERIEEILKQAMDMSKRSNYSLQEAVDKTVAPFLKQKKHDSSVQNLKSNKK